AFRRDHAVHRVFQHEDGIANAERERAAAAAFTDAYHHHRHREPRHFTQIPGDRFRLPALLGIDAGVGPWSVQQRDDGPAELACHLHGAKRLAVAFGLGHAEITIETLLGIPAFLLCHYHYGAAFEVSEPGHD